MKDPVKVLHFMKHEVACAAWAGGPPGVHSQVSMGTVSGIISLSGISLVILLSLHPSGLEEKVILWQSKDQLSPIDENLVMGTEGQKRPEVGLQGCIALGMPVTLGPMQEQHSLQLFTAQPVQL